MDATASYDFVISRSSTDDGYAVWRFDPGADQLLTRVTTRTDLTFDHTHTVIPVGSYLLEWGPIALEQYAACFPYRLFDFDPYAEDPLAGATEQVGTWPKWKFWGTRVDFGNPTGDKTSFSDSDDLVLVPLGNYVLNLILTAGRGTFALWSFDPDPPSGSDPLPLQQTPQGAFRTIELGHELVPMGNFVLDWVPATGEYWVWSFDPQAAIPLVAPPVQHGTWSTIDSSHRLVALGDLVLDWVPADGSYRVWAFDSFQSDPLTGPIDSGQLPAEFSATTTLIGVQPTIPIDPVRAEQPGTIDFMRSKVKHVVYYILENRSFDHVLGWLYDRHEGGINFIGSDRPFDGASVDNYNETVDGTRVYQSIYQGGQLSDGYSLDFFNYDPYHNSADVLEQMFFRDPDGYRDQSVPNMGGFAYNNGAADVMLTYGPEQLPVLNGLAREFAVSDEWFCSMPSATDPNRAFGLAGSSLQQLNNFQNGAQYQYWPMSTHRPSIFKALWSNGIEDFKIYNSVEWMEFVLTYHLFLQGQIPQVDANPSQFISGVDQFFADAKAGQLPALSFIEPVWIGLAGTSSYHPGEDFIPGEQRLNEIYNAISTGPDWDETLLVVIFDEHGGIYDHVPPPRAVNPWPNDHIDGFHFDVLGPRVPAIVVSPHIERQTVFRSGGPVAYDSTSVLATVLEWCGVPRARWGLGERTRHAPTFEGLLQKAGTRIDLPSFTPPYDQQYPRAGEPNVAARPLTEFEREMVPRAVWALTRGTLDPTDTHALAHKIMDGADVASVHAALTKLAAKFD